jgi:hypothetical protein
MTVLPAPVRSHTTVRMTTCIRSGVPEGAHETSSACPAVTDVPAMGAETSSAGGIVTTEFGALPSFERLSAMLTTVPPSSWVRLAAY